MQRNTVMCPKCCRILWYPGKVQINTNVHVFPLYLTYNLDCYHLIKYEESMWHLLVLFAVKEDEADVRAFTSTQSHAPTQMHALTHLAEKLILIDSYFFIDFYTLNHFL